MAVGDYVIVKYDEEFYPSALIALGEYTKVCKMIKSGPNYWKWPTREDIVDYEFEKVVKIKQQPMYQTEAHFASQNLII